MCVSHLVCMFTVISIVVHTVIQELNLLFGQLSKEVLFSCTSEGSSACLLCQVVLPALNQMALSYSRGRCVECKHCRVYSFWSRENIIHMKNCYLFHNICTNLTFFFQVKFYKQDSELLK